MASYLAHPTQREAIRAASQAAKERARQQETIAFECVLLYSGDTLTIAATPSGSVTHSRTPGWHTDGCLWCSKRTKAIASH